ncbi:MAG: BREX-1 system adenine-specific DNA-methyltransferase PglX, partial [Bacillaceae bacterium]|nr:BREX-1 system adenine-specific DNA-methyltransferase PglX [Bacillaceae bacterium]
MQGKSGDTFDNVCNLIKQFINAKTIGSIIKVNVKVDQLKLLKQRLNSIECCPAVNLFEEEIRKVVIDFLPKLIKQIDIMYRQYDILVTNPPYMGSGNMNDTLSKYLKEYYLDSRADLYACFMELSHFIRENGLYACINQHSWMFLPKFEKLRSKLLKSKIIINMIHLGPRTFEEIGGEVVQSTAFILKNKGLRESKGIYVRLVESKTASAKRKSLIETVNNSLQSNTYFQDQSVFFEIPGNPVAYWA